MLNSYLPYNNLITMFYNGKSTDLLSDDDWNNCIVIHKFLKHFYDTIKILSR